MSRPKMLIVMAVALVQISVISAQIGRCGMFDVFLILDRSSSISNTSWDMNVNFVKTVTARFKSDYTRYAIYTFSDTCKSVLSLTYDTAKITAATNALVQGNDEGTDPGLCLQQANTDLVARSVKHVPIYVVVTDGQENRHNGQGKAMADAARALGVQVYVVHVGSVTDAGVNVIRQMANTPLDHYSFDIATYAELATEAFIQSLVTHAESRCLMVSCIGGVSTVDIRTNQTIPFSSGLCSLYDSANLAGRPVASVPALTQGAGKWNCSLPHELVPKQYTLVFTADGIQQSVSTVDLIACGEKFPHQDDVLCVNGGHVVDVQLQAGQSVSAASCEVYEARALTMGTTAELDTITQLPAANLGSDRWRCALPASVPEGEYALLFMANKIPRLFERINLKQCHTVATAAKGLCVSNAAAVNVSVQASSGVRSVRCRLYNGSALVMGTDRLVPYASANASSASAGWLCRFPGSWASSGSQFTVLVEVDGVQRSLSDVAVMECSALSSGGDSSSSWWLWLLFLLLIPPIILGVWYLRRRSQQKKQQEQQSSSPLSWLSSWFTPTK